MSSSSNRVQGDHPYRQAQRPVRPPVRALAVAARSPVGRIPLAVLVAVGVWIGVIGWREHRLNEAVSALPQPLQEQTYRRAYDELATVCTTQRGLDAHCRDEAELILRFPQCEGECRTLARRLLPVGTK
jgi:hypothetical protein